MTLARTCAFPMNGGDGPNSYKMNSSGQGSFLNACKAKILDVIERDEDMVQFLSSGNDIHIADLGCSVGPNTFMVVGNILQALERKHLPAFRSTEFQVFFNDHVSNDFNTLFDSLPADRRYYAAAVPGSFYGRLFPACSLHVAHSSFAIHWLSRVPQEIVGDRSSAGWNGGRIHYWDAPEGVARAYASQFSRDMSDFLSARAAEIVRGGLLLLIVFGTLDGIRPSQCISSCSMRLLESCLVELSQKGRIEEEKIDSFNLPLYFPCLREVVDAIERNGGFTVVRAETYNIRDDAPWRDDAASVHQMSQQIRAPLEPPIAGHFGTEIMDDLFHLFERKVTVTSSHLREKADVHLFLALKRAY